LSGFYAGSLPNVWRGVFKSIYRFPMMIGMSELMGDMNREKKKLMTSCILATLESFVLCPLERLKVYSMTEEGINSHIYRAFFT